VRPLAYGFSLTNPRSSALIRGFVFAVAWDFGVGFVFGFAVAFGLARG